MQAVILAAGRSSRMFPFENGIHKSMIRIMGKPILHYTIEALKNSGIDNIIIVTNGQGSIEKYFEAGQGLGVSIKYVVQEKPDGAGDALGIADKHIEGDFILLNASHVEVDTFVNDLLKGKKKDIKAVLLAKEKNNFAMQGMLRFSGDRVEGIIEKPKEGEEPSNVGVVGIYLLEKGFLEVLRKTPKEHYQLESAISLYTQTNYVSLVVTSKETVSLKYPWDLLHIKDYLFKKIKRSISNKSEIAQTAEIMGEVIVEDGVRIMEGVRIKGPCFIGKNSYIGNNALLRGGVDVGKNSVVGSYMELKNTIIMENSTTHSGFIGDSVIGENCKIAAQFCTGNVRLDRKIIAAEVRECKVLTGCKYLGVFIGEKSNIGIKVSSMPGIIIGKSVTVGPSTVVMRNISSNTKYYTKFQEIISKKNE
ncbi:MAG: sugar phosphate nucleotidyltransferase [Candidatus Levybacteria bacterium]|nr:sugar phosphate nucleotidyltransferase [Candidatus Levybacteria bacterium]MDZ4227657.1 bifunctional sugar-1-phosphate nucleotidylyltransferase/acetyltransferase [Candidatus Levybacteria bacterium]